MPKRLRISRLDRVGFVDKGDDPEATLVFWKRAETFSEQGDEQKLRNELWDTAHSMSRALESALFDAEEDQDPEALILTSLDQFVATVKAKLPMWLQGKAVDKNAKAKPDVKEVPAVLKSEDEQKPNIWATLKKLAVDMGWPKEEIDALGHDEGSSLDQEGEGNMEFDVTTLPEEAQAEFTKLQDQIKELEAAKPDDGGGGDEGEDGINKAELPEAVRKALEKAEEDAESARQEVAKIRGEREREKFLKAAQEYSLPGWTADDCGPILQKIHGALDEDEVKKITEVFKGASEMIAQSDLLKAVGAGGEGEGDGSAEAAANAKAEELQKSDPDLTKEQALAKVWKADHKLYERYRAEQDERLRERKP